jgi:hypothetical protein
MRNTLSGVLLAMLLILPSGAFGAKKGVNLKKVAEAYPVLKGMKILCVKRALPI